MYNNACSNRLSLNRTGAIVESTVNHLKRWLEISRHYTFYRKSIQICKELVVPKYTKCQNLVLSSKLNGFVLFSILTFRILLVLAGGNMVLF